jgi:hypothetical protein
MYSQKEKDGMAMKNATIDKFAARGDGDGANRGERMVARGERKIARGDEKIAKATEKLGNRLENKSDRAENKLERIEKRAGGFPTLGQSERISAQKSQVSKLKDNKESFNEPYREETGSRLVVYRKDPKYSDLSTREEKYKFQAPEDGGNKVNRSYNQSAQLDIDLAKKKQARGEEKISKGERLVKKGTMLSAKINNRRKG